MSKAASRVIWSADVPTMKALGRGLRDLSELEIVKIDRAFMENRNPSIVARIQDDYGVHVFDDAKIIEIPTKMEQIALKHLKYRPWMMNCMAGGVSSRELDDPKTLDGLKRFADACHLYGTKPCGVTVLTSKTEEVVMQEFDCTAIEQVLYYVGVLLECGFTDIVCSPLEVPAIKAEPAFADLELNTPGIVMPGGDTRDQARTDTPGAALKFGSTRLVIGGALTLGDRVENFKAIVRDIELANAV